MEKDLKKNYGAPNCPVRNVLDRIGDKWSILIILLLGENDTLRFGELDRLIENISQKMLTVTLKTLEADGLIERKSYGSVPPKVEYSLTSLGKSIIPPVTMLAYWAESNMPEIMASRAKYLKNGIKGITYR